MVSATLQDMSKVMVVPSKVQGVMFARELGDIGAVEKIYTKSLHEALEQIKSLKPEMVISTTSFEDGDGITLVNAMREDSSLDDTIFILFSSEARYEMIQPIRDAGVAALLSQPFSGEALDQAVQVSARNNFVSSLSSVKGLDTLLILLVSKNPVTTHNVVSVLGETGVQADHIQVADNGDVARGKLKVEMYDLMITDCDMPNIEGDELFRQLAENAEQEKMPVIMVQSGQQESDIVSIKSSGVTSMLKKPFDIAIVQALLGF